MLLLPQSHFDSLNWPVAWSKLAARHTLLPWTTQKPGLNFSRQTMSEKSVVNDEAKGTEMPAGKGTSILHGEMDTIDDPVVSDFYGSAVSEAYRLKSELVAKHLAEIGMGK